MIWGIIFIAYTISIVYFYHSIGPYLYLFSVINVSLTFLFVLYPFKAPLYKFCVYFMKIVYDFIFPFGRKKMNFKLVLFSTVMSTFSQAYVLLVLAMCIFWCPECRDLNYRKHCDVRLPAAYVL